MDKKLKATLVAATAAVAAFSTTAVKADEVTQPETPEAVEATVTEVKVTEQDVKDATAKADQAQDAVKKQEAVVTEKTTADKKAGDAVTNADKAVKDAESATPEAIKDAKEAATKATTAVTDAKTAESTAAANVATAKDAVSTATTEKNTAQANADQAAKAEKAAQAKVNSLGGGSTALTEAEKASREATAKVQTAGQAKTQADAELTTAKADDAKAATALQTAQNAKAKADKDLKNLGAQPKGYDFSDVKFTLNQQFVAALRKRNALMGKYYEESINKNQSRLINEIFKRDKEEVRQNLDELKRLADTAKAANTYRNTTDTRLVDVYNLTEEQKTEINLFGQTIVNQIRTALGLNPLKTTVGMQKFANEAAESRTNNNAFKVSYSLNDPVNNPYPHPKNINIGDYYYKGINDAARANGLATAKNENEAQHQGDVAYSESYLEQDRSKYGFEKTYGTGFVYINSQSKRDIASVLAERKEFPKFTMGELKERIYDAYKKLLFTENIKDTTGKEAKDRYWESALSVGGLIDYRNNSSIGLDSIYGATSISVSEEINELVPDTKPEGNKNYRYHVKPRIYVYNFQSAGEKPNLNNLSDDAGAFILDPSKFDATEIKNDPNAVAKYNSDKKALEDAVKKADAALATANSYKAKTPAAQDKVNKATTALNEAKTAEKAAQDKVVTLRAAQNNQSESLRRAQAELATAQANVRAAQAKLATAQAKLQTAQTNLESANANLEKAKELVATKEKEATQANQTVKDLEDAQASLAQRKVALATAKTAKEKAEKDLTEAQNELKRLQDLNDKAQAEKKDVLERYRKQNPITDHGEPWIEPALPEFPIGKVPGGNGKVPVYPPKSPVQPMAHKPAPGSKSVVPVAAAKQLPNTGDNSSLAAVAMGVVAAVSAFGLTSKRKED